MRVKVVKTDKYCPLKLGEIYDAQLVNWGVGAKRYQIVRMNTHQYYYPWRFIDLTKKINNNIKIL